jgi:hypothetical protein
MASLLGGLFALAACSDYAEGDRCQAENGNDDCQTGLVCLAATNKAFNGGVGLVNAPYNTSDRCCPFDRTTATHPACTLLQISGAADSAPPPDTGPVPDATSPQPDAAEASVPDAATADANDDGG